MVVRSKKALTRVVPRGLALVALLLAVAVCGACGGSGTSLPDPSLSPPGQAGLETMRSLGCGACHGANGQGVDGLGPSLQSLLGSETTLSDGSVVVADADYIRLAVSDPEAQIVQGFGLPMPPYRLDDADMDALLALLEELE